MKESMKKTMRTAMECEANEMPSCGVVTLDLNSLRGHGILCRIDGDQLRFWHDPEAGVNEEFSAASVVLCNAGNFNGPEEFQFYDAINRAELNIRLVRAFQGRGGNHG